MENLGLIEINCKDNLDSTADKYSKIMNIFLNYNRNYRSNSNE